MTRHFMITTIVWLALLLQSTWAAAGNVISFSATADIAAAKDRLEGRLKLALNAQESIYNVVLFGAATGVRTELGRLPIWQQNTNQEFLINLPGQHRFPGQYHALVEVIFQDQGGGNLSSNLALDYQVADYTLLSDVDVVINGDQLVWKNVPAAEPPPQLQLAPAPGKNWQANVIAAQQTGLPAISSGDQRRVRPDHTYDQLARIDWSEQQVHGSRLVHWRFKTDSNGNWLRAADPADRAERIPPPFSASATITATPTRLLGEVMVDYAGTAAISKVELTVIGQNETGPLGQLDNWPVGGKQVFHFDIPSIHNMPGLYHLLIPISFLSTDGYVDSATLGLEYKMQRIPITPAPVSASIDGRTVHWNLGTNPVADLLLRLTTGPSWSLVSNPLGPNQQELLTQPQLFVSPVPNWSYTQLARLEWTQNGEHFSHVSSWEIRTDSSGQWPSSARANLPIAVDLDTPIWRQPKVLWFVAAILGALAFIFGVLAKPKQNTDGQ